MCMNRRTSVKLLGLGTAGLLTLPGFSRDDRAMIQRKIPSSGEWLPVVGVGTWQTFDVESSGYGPLKEVLSILNQNGGSVIDSSPMYGRSESVVGTLTKNSGSADDYFYATKVWTTGKSSGIEQMQQSFHQMRRKTMDLMQIHNLVDWKTHLNTLKAMKEEGKIRYIGLTHYTDSSHSKLEEIISKESAIDFIQFNYSLESRNAEKRLLNAARDKGVAVIINRPYEGGSVFGRVRGKSLPDWAEEHGINSWGQFFLKYILSHPSVNCVIPGTDKPHHMLDNVKAGFGTLPDASFRKQMVEYYGKL